MTQGIISFESTLNYQLLNNFSQANENRFNYIYPHLNIDILIQT